MKKFLLFVLLLIPVPVFAIFYSPPVKNVYYSTANGGLTSVSAQSTSLGGTPYWRVTSNASLYRWVINFDFTGINQDYITFNFKSYNTMPQGYLSIEGLTCEAVPNTVPSQVSYIQLVSYGFVCPNPHQSDVWVSYEVGDQGTATYDLWWPKSIAAYDDANTAQIITSINNQTNQQDAQNQIINNTNTGNNASDFSNVVNNNTLPNNSHAFDILGGLQSFINGLQPSGSCSRISVPIPFTNQTLILPCMTTDVYSVHFPEIVVIWQLLVRGIAYYYILVNILRLVKETIDPFNFKLEVMDL